jgi:hypothetical protein
VFVCETVAEFVKTANAPIPTRAAATVTSEIDNSSFVPTLRRGRIRRRRDPSGSRATRVVNTSPALLLMVRGSDRTRIRHRASQRW